METCRFFAKGRCAFGTACRLAHVAGPGTAAAAAAAYAPPAAEPAWEESQGSPPWPDQGSYYEDVGSVWAPAASSTQAASGSATDAPQSEAPSREADTRELRKVQKAIREIDSLEARRAAGEGLQNNQLRKIEKRAELVEKLEELEARVAAADAFEVAAPAREEAQADQRLQALAAAVAEPPQPPPPPAPVRTAPAGRQPIGPRMTAERAQDDRPVCRHFLAGRCSFGDACRNSHVSVGSQPPPNAGKSRPENQSYDADDPECGICFDSIRKKGERFGLLESCDHAFCLTCIRSWRKQKEQQDRQNLRLCPVCRNESFFVVPSDDIIMDAEEKSRRIAEYKGAQSCIPCKLFDYGRGSCPFGTSCFYAHLNPDGTRHLPPALRWRNGADGSEVIGEVKLSDFLTRAGVA